MSYCRFQNTLSDLRDCRNDLEVESREEHDARRKLLKLCAELAEYAEDYDYDFVDDDDENEDETGEE